MDANAEETDSPVYKNKYVTGGVAVLLLLLAGFVAFRKRGFTKS
jgi:hypothetical protein